MQIKNAELGHVSCILIAEPDCEVPVETSQTLLTNNRIGLHYFPDTLHYRMRDLEVWLPHLSRMGIGWLTLLAPLERAIPEYFLNGLFSSGLQPVLHFQFPTQASTSSEGLRLLFSNYARWGVRYVTLYDQPNSRLNWSPAAWAQMDLVERFLDLYVPLAESALDEGLIPVFPPLEPGGDYWDLSFLQSALRGLQRRGRDRLLDKLVLGAYAWTGNRSLEWGAGGPERWPQAVPYNIPADSEDQRGFRIFDWYLAVSQLELGKRLPLLLLRVGSTPNDRRDPTSGEPDYLAHAEQNLTIARLLANETVEGCSPVPPEIKAGNFWLLTADEKSVLAGQGWFRTEEEKLPVVTSFYRFSAGQREAKYGLEAVTDFDTIIHDDLFSSQTSMPVPEPASDPVASAETVSRDNTSLEAASEDAFASDVAEVDPLQADQPDLQAAAQSEPHSHTISHYVLLPVYAWGAADWDLEVIQPFLQESHPTVGFSLAEARLAARVTVVGGNGAISAEALNMLRASGCKVERVMDDGTLVAS
jgi:hypothetical protein